jgi:hypothetical protein
MAGCSIEKQVRYIYPGLQMSSFYTEERMARMVVDSVYFNISQRRY